MRLTHDSDDSNLQVKHHARQYKRLAAEQVELFLDLHQRQCALALPLIWEAKLPCVVLGSQQ